MVYFVLGTFIVVIGKKRKEVQIYKDIIKKFVPVILTVTAIFYVEEIDYLRSQMIDFHVINYCCI